MRAVIYDPEDLEPITVIDIPQEFVREIEQGKRPPYLRFAILDEPKPTNTVCEHLRTAEVVFERLRYKDKTSWMVMAMDPEMCLLLKSDLLPGQHREVQKREKIAFLRGMALAMGG